MKNTTRVLAFRVPADLHRRLRALALEYGGLRGMLEPHLEKVARMLEDRRHGEATAVQDERDGEASRPSQSVA